MSEYTKLIILHLRIVNRAILYSISVNIFLHIATFASVINLLQIDNKTYNFKYYVETIK